MFRRTKIVATVGPASSSRKTLQDLMTNGVNVFRLNFSHGDHDDKRAIIRRIRDISARKALPIAILGDLQGPKIRVGQFREDAIPLEPGQQVTITTRQIRGEGSLIPTGYPQLPQCVVPGERILLDDGMMELTVLETGEDEVRCEVRYGGLLKNRKGINLPGAAVAAPCLTEKDRSDLQFCIAEEIDYIALSFVRRASDVQELKDLIKQAGSDIPVISKIEKPQAVDNFDAILQVTDGIMVARGDLGVEMNAEQVPLIQKQIIRKCNRSGKPVITATQMLESMIDNPRPTRAEVSDVANAILDGTDAVMLSAETAAGKYPAQAVALMDRVARDVEGEPQLRTSVPANLTSAEGENLLCEGIGQAACRLAENIQARAILAFTQSGSTAALVAKFRPALPIYAITPSVKVQRRLALYSTVHSLLVNHEGSTEAQINAVSAVAVRAGVLSPGDIAVITMGSPSAQSCPTNLMKAHRLEAAV